MVSRILRLCIVCVTATTLAACASCGGDNNENNETNNNTTATNNDTSTTNNDTNNDTNNGNNPTNNNGNNPTNNGGAQCDAAGDTCVEGEDTNAGFLCVEGTCRSECAAQNDCRAGSVCYPISETLAYCRNSECEGWLDFDGCDAGLKCIEVANDAAICEPTGTGAEGEACMEFGQCGNGLVCAFGTCNAICDADATCDEAGGERCILDTLATGVGFCAVGCDSYSTGQCPAGQGCFPITSNDGVCDAVGTVGAYQACTAPEDCGENTACITFQSADQVNGIPQVARCLPFCDPTAATQAQANATCPGGAQNGNGRFVHLAEGAGDIDIYVDDVLTVDDLAFGETSSAGAFTSLTVGMHKVDIVAFDAADNTTPILTVNQDVAANDAVTWGIVPDAAATLAVLTVDVPPGEAAPTAGSSKLRAVHAIPDFGGNADVVAVPAGAIDFTNEVELALDLALGEAGAFVEVPAADYDIYLFPAGGLRTVANVGGVTVTGVTVPADQILSVWARGTTDITDSADPGLTNVSYASAAAGGALSGYCLNLGETPSPQSGFCLEQCPDSDTFATDACSGPSDYCSPATGGNFLCFPGGPNTQGEACDPNNTVDGCDGTSYCQQFGDGSGQCYGFCQPDAQTNPSLGCNMGETCVERGTNFGLCGVPCTPTDFSDASCPANLQTCIPADRGEDALCGPSGATALGGACEMTAPACSPGDSCANEFARGDLAAEDPFSAGVCAATCDPFGDGSECGANEVCAINWFTLNRAAGICTAPDENLMQNGMCQAEFNVCGQASFCLDVGGGPQCLRMCDLDDATTCPMGSCMQLFNSADIRLGACI